MEQLHNGITLELADSSFPLSTDSVALAGFVRLPRNARVLDLGSGCGTLGLLLCGRDPGCVVTGLELSREDHQMALENSRRNQLEKRLTSVLGDITDHQTLLPPGSFDVCISNPPYFSGGLPSLRHTQARSEQGCALEDVFQAASYALRWGGDFFLVHKPERLAQCCALGSQNGLEAKDLCLLRHRVHGPVSLILLSFRKGAKPGLRWQEQWLFEADGQPSLTYRTLYHIT